MGILSNITMPKMSLPPPFGFNGDTEVIPNEDKNDAYVHSKTKEEKLAHLYVQLTRRQWCDDGVMNTINDFVNISNEIYYINNDVKLKSLCVKMIAHTRDIIYGKGEYEETYRLLTEFALSSTYNDARVDKAKQLIYYLVNPLPIEGNEHPYGSWKDIKKFMDYVRKYKEIIKNKDDYEIENSAEYVSKLAICDDLITYCINLYIIQLKHDIEAMENGHPENVSLCAKWIPREKSKYGWVFKRVAHTIFSYSRDNNTAYGKFRKLIAALNRVKDTLEIKQCGNKYSEIDFKNVPRVAMIRQKHAFMNNNKSNSRTSRTHDDRVMCAQNFKYYTKELVDDKRKINPVRNNIAVLVEFALESNNFSELEQRTIETHWSDFSTTIGDHSRVVAMVDGSLYRTPRFATIGMGLCVAMKSCIGKRVLTFNDDPSWVDLDECSGSLIEMVAKIKDSDMSRTTNLYKGTKLMLDKIVEQKMSVEKASNMVLVVLTDIHESEINKATNERGDLSLTMEEIRNMYNDAGLKACGKPYDPPHIILWNLRPTKNFPYILRGENITTLSGYNNQLLNEVMCSGVDSLMDITPYKMMVKILSNPRYDIQTFIESEPYWMLASSNIITQPYREYIKAHYKQILQTSL